MSRAPPDILFEWTDIAQRYLCGRGMLVDMAQLKKICAEAYASCLGRALFDAFGGNSSISSREAVRLYQGERSFLDTRSSKARTSRARGSRPSCCRRGRHRHRFPSPPFSLPSPRTRRSPLRRKFKRVVLYIKRPFELVLLQQQRQQQQQQHCTREEYTQFQSLTYFLKARVFFTRYTRITRASIAKNLYRVIFMIEPIQGCDNWNNRDMHLCARGASSSGAAEAEEEAIRIGTDFSRSFVRLCTLRRRRRQQIMHTRSRLPALHESCKFKRVLHNPQCNNNNSYKSTTRPGYFHGIRASIFYNANHSLARCTAATVPRADAVVRLVILSQLTRIRPWSAARATKKFVTELNTDMPQSTRSARRRSSSPPGRSHFGMCTAYEQQSFFATSIGDSAAGVGDSRSPPPPPRAAAAAARHRLDDSSARATAKRASARRHKPCVQTIVWRARGITCTRRHTPPGGAAYYKVTSLHECRSR
ncbi:unnamed protein product [Trichogramma brassicae]|uniref:Uncharacterized protein n=1 Tax=Trichogramma brassicae TaxID=86971 RepID=A0A6H5I196_9HYME|nr:unnamed protein product [Trichogramma brassicae]